MWLRGLLYCLVSGLVFAVARAQGITPNSWLAWLWLQGVLLAAAFLPAARWGPSDRRRLFAVIWPILAAVGAFTLHSEVLIFTTFSSAEVLVLLRDDLLAFTALAAALVFLAHPLRITQEAAAPAPVRPRWSSVVWRTALGGVAYLVLYFVFGGLFYQLFTRPYFEDPAAPLRTGEEVVLGLGLWFPLIQIGRGMLMVAASAPLVFSLRMSRRAAGIVLGIIFWVVGGLGPLILPNESLPPLQRMYHIFEILFQHGGLGLLAVWLLRPKLNDKQYEGANA